VGTAGVGVVAATAGAGRAAAAAATGRAAAATGVVGSVAVAMGWAEAATVVA
jgi:hypothetical protein